MILRALLLTTGLTLATALCRFTVRDVGFVDLGDSTYQCLVFVSDTKSPSVASAAREAAKTVFADTNIEFAIVDLDDEHHDAHRHARKLNIERFPTTVLVRPDGESIEVPFDGTFAAVGTSTLESVASSKLRRHLITAVIRRYCVVILTESGNATKDDRARRGVKAAFKAIDRVFDKMPKDVGALPELISVPRAEHTAESVLLWSLDIRGHGTSPVVTVMTGRGRRFGDNLIGDEITEDSILDILAKAGQSCECGLDRSWMSGTRVPLRWDAATQQLAADVLGFDPENPLVKAEVSSILAKGPRGQGDGSGPPTVADLLLGYSEEDLLFDEPGDEPRDEPGEANNELADGGLTDEDSTRADDQSSRFAVLATLGGLILASLSVAGFVLWRVRQN